MNSVTADTAGGSITVPCAAPMENADGERLSVMIDGFNLSLEKGTGVATYARNLSTCLRDMGCKVGVLYGTSATNAQHPLLQEIGFFDDESASASSWERVRRNIRASVRPNFNRGFSIPMSGTVVAETFKSQLPYFDTIWNAPEVYRKAAAQFNYLKLINKVSFPEKPDIFHWTYPLPMQARHVPNIYTLHDLVPLRLPYTTLDKKNRYLQLMQWIAKKAHHVVTVSEHSRRDLINILGMRPESVTNTYQSVSIPAAYRLKPEGIVRREIQGTFGFDFKGYYLFFGSIEPKKNVGRLIEAYLASGVRTPLVIVGAQAWKSEKELRLLTATTRPPPGSDGSERGQVIKLEYASFPLLVNLIRGAKAVLFPSLYEGFGLPVLESMLLGVPVLTSNTSSLPEVAGEAALMVDPYAIHDIAEGIRALDSNESLRAELSARGPRQAERFSEAAHRQRLTSVYEEVLARHGKHLRHAVPQATSLS